ncbi:cell division ATP-binding protein FtsE [Clostridium ihumii]|uniref:cell division ATP-binding protein FtsE n=1 Tax=Clostridium ihumii TaxID=1470356 RepID=UPI000552522D|nr:cell division ATP-binding protein FtsE [Clostridium ihumii]
MINFKNVTKNYNDKNVAVNNINMKVSSGEFVFLVGLSGSGKSSVIKMILGETKATKGIINVDNCNIFSIKEKDMPYFRRKIGVVFQDFRLLPQKTVYQNVEYAMKVVEAEENDINKKVPQILKLVGLHKKANCYPHELSGGEQQRVAVARAIINEPKILLADEPTGNLDPITAKEIVDLLVDINNRGTTVIMATHDTNIVNSLKKRVISMSKGVIISDNEDGEYIIEA